MYAPDKIEQKSPRDKGKRKKKRWNKNLFILMLFMTQWKLQIGIESFPTDT